MTREQVGHLIDEMNAPIEHHAAAYHRIQAPALWDAPGPGDAGFDLEHIAQLSGFNGFPHMEIIGIVLSGSGVR